MMSWLMTRLRAGIRNRAGNVSIIVALSALPLVGMTGLAADYSMMLSTKAKLDQAADAAALAGVTRAKAYILASTELDPTANAIAAGQAQAKSQFNANTGSLPAGTLTINKMQVTRLLTTLTGNVSYSYQMPTYFMSVFGTKTMTVGGTSTTTLTMQTYVNVFVVIDNSASMGIGATAADQQTVYNATSGNSGGGCALSCHYAASGQPDTVVQAHKAGATLRIDAAKAAVYAGLQSILNLQDSKNPSYKVAVYTMSNNFTKVFPTGVAATSTDIASAMKAVGKDSTSGIDITSTNSDGGTDTTNALQSLAGALPTTGTGLTALTAQGVVIFVTDGVQDSDSKVYNSKTKSYADVSNSNFTPYSPCNQQNCEYDKSFNLYFQSFDPTQCKPIKDAGYTLMTLNVQYLIPADNLQGGNSNLQAVFDYIQNYLAKSIPGNLSACATSSSYAYTATTPDEIAAATQQMFAAIPAAAQARVSK